MHLLRKYRFSCLDCSASFPIRTKFVLRLSFYLSSFFHSPIRSFTGPCRAITVCDKSNKSAIVESYGHYQLFADRCANSRTVYESIFSFYHYPAHFIRRVRRKYRTSSVISTHSSNCRLQHISTHCKIYSSLSKSRDAKCFLNFSSVYWNISIS